MYQAPKSADFGRNTRDIITDFQVYCLRNEAFKGALFYLMGHRDYIHLDSLVFTMIYSY